MPTSPTTTPRVAIICQVMAHYRQAVHICLDKYAGIDFIFASDLDGTHYSLETMRPGDLTEHRVLNNRYWGRMSWQSGVLRLVLSPQFDAYVFTGDVSVLSTWVGAALARLRGKPVLFWTIGWHRPENGLKSLVRLSFYRLASRLMVYGNTARALGTAAGYPRERIDVIYNSVGNTEIISPDTTSVSTHAPVVANLGAIARLNQPKRFDLLLRAASALNKSGRPTRVTLGGDGPEHGPLRALADELEIELDLTGPVYGKENTRNFYEKLDATVIPTYAGLSIIQSLSHGIPVVTDDDIYGQGPEWEAITPQTGQIFQHDDLDSLTHAIAETLDSVANDRRSISDACLKEVRERWNASSQAERITKAILIELRRRNKRQKRLGTVL